MSNTLQKHYREKIAPALKKELGRENVNAVPRIVSVHVNVGIGSYVGAGKDHEEIVRNVEAITGQKPIVQRSKKAISNFKLKINQPTGVVVTLRGGRMYDFVDKLINAVFPRIRDFRGISQKAFDGRGNYSIGLKEHTVFPEIQSEDVNKVHGVQVTIRTTAKNDKESLALMKLMGFPFKH
ncbi:50S ribosomal protein L5 [Candidatus Gracilibacteria bacterium]|nr:50S ribosomal protein L5 [Candidatus Gracilibacteria bacterium]